MNKTQSNSPTGKRDPFFDNARFILVALVVLGHLISPVREGNEHVFFVNNFLASFRMPALILLAGYFTKKIYLNQFRFVKQLLLGIFIPYLLFQIAYLKMDGLAESLDQLLANLFAPNFGMWFLLSLIAWNLLLFPFAKLKYPIVTAFALAIGIGWIEQVGEFLSISRTIVFFPLFLMGHHLHKGQMEWFKKREAKMVSVFSMALSFLILSLFSLDQARNALLARQPYFEIAETALEGSVVRLIFYGVMILGILSFLPWIPQKEMPFTYLGKRTAYVYLLHLFFIKAFYALSLFPSEPGIGFFIALPFVWLAIVFLTSSNAAVFLMKPFVEGELGPLRLRKAPSFAKTTNQFVWLVLKK